MTLTRRLAVFAAAAGLAAGGGVVLGPQHIAEAASQCTWTGATSGSWSDATNWSGCGGAPATGADLVFPAGAPNQATTDDLASAIVIDKMTFTCNATDACYSVAGSGRTVTTFVLATGIGPCCKTVTISEPLILQDNPFIVQASGVTLSFTGTLTGTGQLQVDGPGLVTLANTSDAFASVLVHGTSFGNLEDASVGGGALGPGAVTVQSGGTLTVSGSGSVGNALSLAGTGLNGDALLLGGTASWTGNVTLAADATVGVLLTGTPTISGPISGAHLLTIDDTNTSPAGGSLTLSHSNSYSGGTSVTGAFGLDVIAANAGCFGGGSVSVTGANSSVVVGGGLTIPNAFSVNSHGNNGKGVVRSGGGSGTATVSGDIAMGGTSDSFGAALTVPLVLSGSISGNAQFQAIGPGQVTLGGTFMSPNTFTGGIDVEGGRLDLDKAGAPALGSGAVEVGISVASDLEWDRNIQLLTVGLVVGANGVAHLNGATESASSVSMTGPGEIDLGGGFLALSRPVSTTAAAAPAVIGSSPGDGAIANNSMVFDVAKGTTPAGQPDLLVNSSVDAASLTVAGNQGTSGTAALEAASNTVNGATHISAGTLWIDGVSPTSPVSIDAGATLGGVGTAGVVSSTGGVVSAGHSPGLLSVAGLSLDSASTLVEEINGTSAGTGYDQVSTASGPTLAGTLTVTVGGGFTPTPGQTFVIVRTMAGVVSGTFAGLPEGAKFAASGAVFSISYVGGAGHDVVLTALAGFTTATALASSLNPSTVGQAVTFTATVSSASGTPAGTVTFKDGSTTLGTVSADTTGAAALTTPALGAGSHSITAVYGGSTTFLGSTSPVVVQVVAPAVATPDTGRAGQPPVLTPVALLATAVLLILGAAVLGWRRRAG